MNININIIALFFVVILGMHYFSACQNLKPKNSKEMTGEENLNIALKINAEPQTVDFSNRKEFKLTIQATNQGEVTLDPELHQTKLLVNDVESMAFMFAISNGKREDKWFSLPAKKSVTLSWTQLGEQLFPAPGEYLLQFQLKSKVYTPVKVIVTGK